MGEDQFARRPIVRRRPIRCRPADLRAPALDVERALRLGGRLLDQQAWPTLAGRFSQRQDAEAIGKDLRLEERRRRLVIADMQQKIG
jgi:hypothetical protein